MVEDFCFLGHLGTQASTEILPGQFLSSELSPQSSSPSHIQEELIHFLLLAHLTSVDNPHILDRQILFTHSSSYVQSLLSLQVWAHLPLVHLPLMPQSRVFSHDPPEFQTYPMVTVLNKEQSLFIFVKLP